MDRTVLFMESHRDALGKLLESNALTGVVANGIIEAIHEVDTSRSEIKDLRAQLTAANLVVQTLTEERDELARRIAEAPETTAYVEVSCHLREFTKLYSLWGNPINLKPGEKCAVRIVRE